MRPIRLLGVALLALPLLAPAPAASAARGRAVASRSFSGYDNATLHLIHASGATLVEEGPASGNLPGHVHAVLYVGTTFHGTFTIYTSHGELYGRGSARLHNGGGAIETFSGVAEATGGSGQFRGAHGRGRLYGSFNRHTYRIVLQTRGTLQT